MTEPSIEKSVMMIERGLRHMDHHTFPEYPSPGDIRALIASWRERGEALKARDELIARMWLVEEAK